MRALSLALLAGVTMLPGCGQSEAQIRDELRAQFMNRCNREITPSTSDLPGFDANVFCGCVTDKAMGERSVAELKALFDDSVRPQMLGRQAATECLAQLSGAEEKSVPAPEPDNVSTPSPSPTPAPAPAPAAERERPREKAPEPAAPARPRIEDVRETPQPATPPVAPPRTPPPTPPRTAPPGFTPQPEPAVRDEKAAPGERR